MSAQFHFPLFFASAIVLSVCATQQVISFSDSVKSETTNMKQAHNKINTEHCHLLITLPGNGKIYILEELY